MTKVATTGGDANGDGNEVGGVASDDSGDDAPKSPANMAMIDAQRAARPTPTSPTSRTTPTAGQVTLLDLNADPGRIGLDSMLREIAKLQRLRQITTTLPPDLFAGVPPRLLQRYRDRVASEPIREVRRKFVAWYW